MRCGLEVAVPTILDHVCPGLDAYLKYRSYTEVHDGDGGATGWGSYGCGAESNSAGGVAGVW